MVVHRSRSHSNGHTDIVGIGATVTEDQDVCAVIDRAVDGVADSVQGGAHATGTITRAIQGRNDRRLEATIVGASIQRCDRGQFSVLENGMFDNNLLARRRCALE